PTDCVNIALGNLLDEPPDIVVSGINIGYNTTEALIFSSGTVAGAMEGAFWELPAIAFSQKVPQDLFESVRLSKGQAEGAFAKSLRAAAGHAAAITGDALKTTKTYGQVININFPETTAASTEIVDTYPERIHLGSLYEEVAPNRYEFRFKEGIRMEASDATDRAVLASGRISRSALVFPQVGTRPRS
ncbi:MAG: 5'/3'-nucleotidase SurE, partial [Verrucomicrobiota bacterium]